MKRYPTSGVVQCTANLKDIYIVAIKITKLKMNLITLIYSQKSTILKETFFLALHKNNFFNFYNNIHYQLFYLVITVEIFEFDFK